MEHVISSHYHSLHNNLVQLCVPLKFAVSFCYIIRWCVVVAVLVGVAIPLVRSIWGRDPGAGVASQASVGGVSEKTSDDSLSPVSFFVFIIERIVI